MPSKRINLYSQLVRPDESSLAALGLFVLLRERPQLRKLSDLQMLLNLRRETILKIAQESKGLIEARKEGRAISLVVKNEYLRATSAKDDKGLPENIHISDSSQDTQVIEDTTSSTISTKKSGATMRQKIQRKQKEKKKRIRKALAAKKKAAKKQKVTRKETHSGELQGVTRKDTHLEQVRESETAEVVEFGFSHSSLKPKPSELNTPLQNNTDLNLYSPKESNQPSLENSEYLFAGMEPEIVYVPESQVRERFLVFYIRNEYQKFNRRKCPWSPACHNQLRLALERLKEWDERDLKACVDNFFASEANHSESPMYWLPKLEKYADGPINKYNQPLTEDTYATNAEKKVQRTVQNIAEGLGLTGEPTSKTRRLLRSGNE